MSPRSNSLACLLCAALLSAGAAHAERADRSKPIQLEADKVSLDDATQVGVFSGNVLLTQGTLSISGDEIVATQGKRGFERGLVTGNPAHFRQKPDRGNAYIEGSGARIEYNAVSGIIDIYGDADVKRGLEEVHGEHIVYDLHKETFQASGTHSNEPGGRVHVVIPPHAATSAPASSGDSLPIKPEFRLPSLEEKK